MMMTTKSEMLKRVSTGKAVECLKSQQRSNLDSVMMNID